jgi:hypothetical protein
VLLSGKITLAHQSIDVSAHWTSRKLQEITGAPSGNRLREVLLPALPPHAELQRRLNRRLRQQLHPSLWKKPRGLHLAIDLVLIPYPGQPQTDEAEVVRGEAKSGTTHFHGYATVTIVHDKRRYTLAIRFVQLGETTRTCGGAAFYRE